MFKRLSLISLFIFVFTVLFYSSMHGDSPFFSRGEAREALVTSAMIENNNYVLPLTKAEEISCKPPALHWLGLLTSKIVGDYSEWMIRFPSIFLASLSLTLLFLVFRSLSNNQTAILGILVLGTSIEWLRSASHARVDMCLTFGLIFSLIALYKIVHLWERGFKNYWPWALLCIFASTFAVLSKGPMGLIIPIAVSGVYFILVAKTPKLKKILSFLAFPCIPLLLIVLGLSSVWYFLAYQQQGDLFIKVHLFNENLARFIDVPDFDPGHRKPFYFGFIYFITAFLPWSLFLPLLIAFLWNNRSKLKDMQENAVLFSVIWVTLIFVMGTISSSKRSVYFLPAFPPLAYLVAYSINQSYVDFKKFWRSYSFIKWGLAIATLIFTLALVLICALVFSQDAANFITSFIKKQKDIAQIELYRTIFSSAFEFYFIIIFAIISLFAAFRFVFSNQVIKSTYSLSIAIVLVALSVSISVIPKAAEATNPKIFIDQIAAKIPESAEVYQYKLTFYVLTYYGNRSVPQIKSIEDLNGKESYLVVAESDIEQAMQEAPNAKILLESNFFGKNGNGKLYLLKIPKKPK